MLYKCSTCGKIIDDDKDDFYEVYKHYEDIYCSHDCAMKALHAYETTCKSDSRCDLCERFHKQGETVVVSDWFPEKIFCADSYCFDFSMGIEGYDQLEGV